MPSIVYCRNLSGREADYGSGKDRRRRRSWLALTDTRYYDEGQLLADAITGFGLPVPFVSPHPEDVLFLCKRLRAKQDKNSPTHWTIDAEFDTAPISDQDEEDQNPLDRRAKFSWSTVKYQKAVEKSRNGNAILNSAGDYFDPPPLKDTSRWTVTVTKNMSSVPAGILNWRDKLNADEFTIDGVSVPINYAKIMAISVGDIQKDQDTEYRVLSYTLEFDEDDEWEGVYLNQGYYFKASPKNKRCIDTNGKECVSPMLLDAAGLQLSDPTPETATFEHYDLYDEMTFTGNLPLE